MQIVFGQLHEAPLNPRIPLLFLSSFFGSGIIKSALIFIFSAERLTFFFWHSPEMSFLAVLFLNQIGVSFSGIKSKGFREKRIWPEGLAKEHST